MKTPCSVFLLASLATVTFAQSPVITEFDHNGTLSWSNVVPYTTYRVEWASHPEGPWYSSWGQLATVSGGTNRWIAVSVPLCYRVIQYSQPEAPVLLAIQPASTNTLAQNGDLLALSSTNGFPPYLWSVHDVFRGSIVDASGFSALYMRSAPGNNAVSVTDSRGNSGYFVIPQP